MPRTAIGLWLRYDAIESPLRQRYAAHATEIVVDARGATAAAAGSELKRGLSGLLASPIQVRPRVDRDGALLLALASSPQVRALHLQTRNLGAEGSSFERRARTAAAATLITANSEKGLLYGAFALLRRIQTRQPLDRLDVRDRPALALRLLDHWDNLDRSVERGYAGQSLMGLAELPHRIDPRYTDYARANASIGINGAVLNNVNAKAEVLTAPYLAKAAALADVFRP